MIDTKRQWLLSLPWDSVLNINHSLCQAQKVDPIFNPRTLGTAKAFWDKSHSLQMTLLEALEVCRKAFDHSAFTFNNGNTFAAIGRTVMEDCLRSTPPVESQIIRTTVTHYIAGKIVRRELEDVLRHFTSSMKLSSAAPVPAAAPAPAVAPPLAETRAAV